MSFYMIHMMSVGVIQGIQLGLKMDGTRSACDLYVPESATPPLFLECALLPLTPDIEVRLGEACNYDAAADTCTGQFRPWEVCSAENNMACSEMMPGLELQLPEPWEPGQEAEFCAVCEEAWGWLMPPLDWQLIPAVLGAAFLMGWVLTRWIELPAQALLRGDTWRWTSQKYCCTGDDTQPSAWRCFPSCCPWECCICAYTCACCCWCKCCACCRRAPQDDYDPLPS